MKIHLLKILSLTSLCFALSSSPCFPQNYHATSNENVVAQMNFCISSLTNIIHNKSMSVLEHESDLIVNNLTMEHITGLDDIKDFRIELLDAVSKFEITEEERKLLRRIQSIQRDNMKWAALSNALNPTMLLTGNAGPGMGYQMAFQALLTAARTAVEYNTMQGEQSIEELRAMWDLRKEDLKTINESRKEALRLTYNLYTKYHLGEFDRYTEKTAEQFSKFIAEPKADKRMRLLEHNRKTYEKMADYYYHLGMAYLDLNNYNKAKENFTTYEYMYKKAPLLRYNEKSGCIALARLSNEQNISNDTKRQLIDTALKNMPNNSAAILQCAMIYLFEFHETEQALKMIRTGIEDPKATDRQLLYMAAANLLPAAHKMARLKEDISKLFLQDDKFNVETYVTYLINSKPQAWLDISKLIKIDNVNRRVWYTLWLKQKFNDELHITMPSNILYNTNDICLYVERHSDDKLSIKQLKTSYINAVTAKDFKEVDCFKNNQNLKYLFFDVLIPNTAFILKQNINYEQIKNGDWPRMNEFSLSENDIDDLIEFCEEHTPETNQTELDCEYSDANDQRLHNIGDMEVEFKGDSLRYHPHHNTNQSGYYLRMVFANGTQIMYKYKNHELKPYLYSCGGKIIYADNESMVDYEGKVLKKGTSWLSLTWSKITGWFSSDEVEEKERKMQKEQSPNVSTQEETNPSWLSRTWSKITGWFSSDEVGEQEEKMQKEQSPNVSTQEDTDPSWLSRIWSKITGWFSSDEVENQEEKMQKEQSPNVFTQEDTDPSWLSRIWSKITGWFSNDEAEVKEEIKE